MALSNKARSHAESRNRACANRSEWRFTPGKSPERLSPYYQLPCDFGSSLIASWGSEEGSEPLYFCESHAKGFLSSAASSKGLATAARQQAKKKEPGAEPVAAVQEASAAPPPQKVTPFTQRQPATAAQSSAESCEAIDRQIADLNSQRESILAESDATIDLVAVIHASFEQAILDIIGSATMNDVQKDATIARMEELQKSLKLSAGPCASLLEAHRMKGSLAACLSTNLGLPGDLKPAYRALHDNLEKAVHAALCKNAADLIPA